MTKNYKFTINGSPYFISVEELPADAIMPVGMQMAPAAMAPVGAMAAPEPAPAALTPTVTPANAKEVKSPMPGSMWDIKLAVGDKVKKNQVVMVLEAMKMENEIVSPIEGTIASINVAKGDTINSSQVLFSVAE